LAATIFSASSRIFTGSSRFAGRVMHAPVPECSI
jgi:hypothetical protein